MQHGSTVVSSFLTISNVDTARSRNYILGGTDGTQDEHTKHHSKQFCANSTERAYKTAYLGSES